MGENRENSDSCNEINPDNVHCYDANRKGWPKEHPDKRNENCHSKQCQQYPQQAFNHSLCTSINTLSKLRSDSSKSFLYRFISSAWMNIISPVSLISITTKPG